MLTYAHTPQISQPNSKIFNLSLKSHKERLGRAQMASTILRKRGRTSSNRWGRWSSIYCHPKKLAVGLGFYLADMYSVRRTCLAQRTSTLSSGHVLLTFSASHSPTPISTFDLVNQSMLHPLNRAAYLYSKIKINTFYHLLSLIFNHAGHSHLSTLGDSQHCIHLSISVFS